MSTAPSLHWHWNCTVLRRMLLTNSAFSPTTGATTPTGEEWITQPCGAPLFYTPERTAGVCQSCANGWNHPNNYRADGPRPRAVAAPAHEPENSLESPEAGLLSNLPHDA